MANVERYGGLKVPTSTSAPVLQRADMGPGAAGVLGQGLSEIGGAVRGAGEMMAQHAQQMQALDNKTSADEANTELLKTYNALGYGDNGFYLKQGKAAFDALPDALTSLETGRRTVADSLTNPEARAMFDSQSRQQFAYQMSDMSRHAATQRKRWQNDTADTGMTTAVQTAVLQRANPNAFQGALGEVEKAAMNKGLISDWTPEQVKQYSFEQQSKVYSNVIELQVQDDPLGAEALVQTIADKLTPEDLVRSTRLTKSAAMPQQAAIIADSIFAGGGQGATAVPRDPQTYFSGLAGGQVTITSAQRSAAHNAEVGGVKNSHHLTGNAWDLTPAPGQTMGQLFNQLRASGQHFDELLNEGNHVHVAILGGKTAVPITGENADTHLPELVREARRQAEVVRPGDAVFADTAEQQVRAKAGRLVSDYNVDQTDTKQRLISAMIGDGSGGGEIADVRTLTASYPGAAQDWAKLKPSDQKTILSSMKTMTNAVTPDRLANYQTLKGLQTNDPAKFIKTDMLAADLPLAWKKELIGAQQSTQKGLAKTANQNEGINRAMHLAPVASGLHAAGITSGSDDYNLFTGAMLGEIQNFLEAHPNQKPKDSDLISIANGLMAKKGQGFLGFGGAYGYEVPEAAAMEIRAQVEPRAGRTLTDAEVATFYHRGQANAR